MILEYKKYEIYPDGTFGMKLIKNIGSGTVPSVLKGSFSNVGEAKKNIDRYILSKGRKGNGKTISSSRGK